MPPRSNQQDLVRVGVEVGATISITSDPPQFVRFTLWREKLVSPTDAAASAAEVELGEWAEERMERRIRKLARLARAASRS